MEHREPALRPSELTGHLSADRVAYSCSWEDDELLRRGLDIGPHDDVLAICSAGDVPLALLLAGARSVTAVDLNPAQVALLELKIAGIRALDHEEFTRFVGGLPSRARGSLYQTVRQHLSLEARKFWDSRAHEIERGVVHIGRLERYFEEFRSHLAEVWPGDLLARMLVCRSVRDQAQLVLREGLTPAFEELTGWYFGAKMLAERGRSHAQLRYVKRSDVGQCFGARLNDALTRHSVRTNPFLRFFLTGGFGSLSGGPTYLRPASYSLLRSRLDRLRVRRAELEKVLSSGDAGTFSRAHLSDVFEYMSPAASASMFARLGQVLRPGGRIAYWDLLVPRPVPPHLSTSLTPLSRLSHELHQRDRVWFYGAFHLYEVNHHEH